ncbi:Uncharacterised protein [Candidatus Norongarragalina meridionalis]|nr:Uncharacterised protein [Candidatus Norongarragalina meridionalis]
MAELLQKVMHRRNLVIGVFVLLLLGFFIGAAVDGGSQTLAKKDQARLEKQMQDTVSRHREDLLRQRVESDAAMKGELMKTIRQYVLILNYDMTQINATKYEYKPQENVSDANFAGKVATARKFAVQANDFYSHVDGFVGFITENQAEIERLSGASMNVSEGTEEFTQAKASLKEIENTVALELETFAKSNSYMQSQRMAILGNTPALLRGTG